MKNLPILNTERLILRMPTLEDARDVQHLAGDFDIALLIPGIPHPYEDGMAEVWIYSCCNKYEKNESLNFAITLRTSGNLIGAIELGINPENERGELGYWIGKPYWNRGYATEAAKVVVGYGFEVLQLNRIHAYHFKQNTGSGRVLEKIGMCYEGCRRQHIKKWDNFEDVMEYGILKTDYKSLSTTSP